MMVHLNQRITKLKTRAEHRIPSAAFGNIVSKLYHCIKRIGVSGVEVLR